MAFACHVKNKKNKKNNKKKKQKTMAWKEKESKIIFYSHIFKFHFILHSLLLVHIYGKLQKFQFNLNNERLDGAASSVIS